MDLHGTKRPSAITEVKHQPSHVNLPSDETDKTFQEAIMRKCNQESHCFTIPLCWWVDKFKTLDYPYGVFKCVFVCKNVMISNILQCHRCPAILRKSQSPISITTAMGMFCLQVTWLKSLESMCIWCDTMYLREGTWRERVSHRSEISLIP